MARRYGGGGVTAGTDGLILDQLISRLTLSQRHSYNELQS